MEPNFCRLKVLRWVGLAMWPSLKTYSTECAYRSCAFSDCRREKSLGLLSQKFVQLFLVSQVWIQAFMANNFVVLYMIQLLGSDFLFLPIEKPVCGFNLSPYVCSLKLSLSKTQPGYCLAIAKMPPNSRVCTLSINNCELYSNAANLSSSLLDLKSRLPFLVWTFAFS